MSSRVCMMNIYVERDMSKQTKNILFLFLLFWAVMFFFDPIFCANKTGGQPISKMAAAHFKKGEKLFLAGNLAEAEKEFWETLNDCTQHSRSHYYLAQIYYKKGNYESALSHIENAEKFYGNNLEDRTNELKNSIAKLKEVITNLNNDLSQLPSTCGGTTPGANELGSLIREKEIRKSEMEFILASSSKSPAQKPAEYEYVHGNIYFKLQNYPSAKEHYLEAIAGNPYYQDAYNNLIYIYCLLKDFKQAKHHADGAKNLGMALNPSLIEFVAKNFDQMNGIDTRGVERFSVPVKSETGTLYVNTYIVFNQESKQAILIDPGMVDDRIEAFIRQNNLKILKILNTHGHFDHSGANRYYADQFNVAITAHSDDQTCYSGKFQKNLPTEFLVDQKSLDAGDFKIFILHTPGHSPGSVCYYINNHLFSGDTLLKETIGKVDGNSEEDRKLNADRLADMIKQKLFVLPEQTTVFPGHGENTTIRLEIENNFR
jgi:hydroxyacylglutathione hydrolase